MYDTQAEASTTSSTASVNSSRRRLWAISWNSGRSSQRPAASTATIASTPPRTDTTLSVRPQPVLARREHGAERQERHEGQVLEQQHAKASRPWVRLSSARSVSCCSRIAVELMATAPPSTMATSQRRPSRWPSSANTAAVAATCAAPSPNTSRRMASMRGSENSRPRVNSRKATPSSASSRVAPVSETTPSACGPSTSPTAR